MSIDYYQLLKNALCYDELNNILPGENKKQQFDNIFYSPSFEYYVLENQICCSLHKKNRTYINNIYNILLYLRTEYIRINHQI